MSGFPDYDNGIELPDVGQIFVAPEDGFVSVQSIQYNDKVGYSLAVIDILNDKDEIVLTFGNRCISDTGTYNFSNIFLPIPKGTRLRINNAILNQKSHKKFFPLLKS